MTIRNHVEALQRTAIFGAVSPDSLKALAASARERKLNRGEILFTRGDRADGLYVVVSGSIRAFRESKDGRKQTIHVETAGATLAEVAVFDHGAYPSTTMAEEDAVCPRPKVIEPAPDPLSREKSSNSPVCPYGEFEAGCTVKRTSRSQAWRIYPSRGRLLLDSIRIWLEQVGAQRPKNLRRGSEGLFCRRGRD